MPASILSAYAATAGEITMSQLILCTLASLALGLVCAGLYMYKNQYNRSFVVTLALMPAIVQMVIMLVNGNLGTGIAVMGAFSLVRFRSLPGTAREIGSIFLAMAIGLATGTGYLGIAAIFTLILGAAQFALSYLHFGETQTGDKTLKVTIPEGLDYEGAFDDLFQKYTRSVSLEKVKTSNMGSLFELEYRLTPAAEQSEKEFLDALRTRNGNLPISISRTATVREDLL